MIRHHNNDDDFEVLPDGRRILKDGRSVRVSLMMKDSMTPLQHAIAAESTRRTLTDGHGNGGLALHRPGFRVMNDTAAYDARAEIERAHREYLDTITNAWRSKRPTGDHEISCETDAPRNRYDGWSLDAIMADHQARMGRAYAANDASLCERWRHP